MSVRRSDRIKARSNASSTPGEKDVVNLHREGGRVDSSTHQPSGYSPQMKFLLYTIIPLWLMLFTPNFAMFVYHLCYRYGGAFHGKFFSDVHGKGPRHIINFLWPGKFYGSPFSVVLVLGYITWAVFWTVVLPGRIQKGPVTPNGHVPKYKENGFTYYILTIVSFTILQVLLLQNGYTVSIVMDRFDEILRTLNYFALVFCLFLYIKGRVAPNCMDSGLSGNFIFDYYWGTELYPRIGGVDVKLVTNCRVGMMSWALLVLIHCIKSYELHGSIVNSMGVSAFLQMMYFTKFFYWEMGYMRTIDIMLDRAGFMICWGCLVWIPGFYTVSTMYLIKNPVPLPPVIAAGVLAGGIISLLFNYWADYQKQVVRETGGECHIWGRKADVIRARYSLADGSQRESLLLTSGFWGMARHFHYLPELTLALCWALPAGFTSALPYFLLILLLVLLVHRTYRDDRKCEGKYGEYWHQYQRKVPYRIIPGVY